MIGISSSNVGYSRSVVDAKIAAVSGMAGSVSGVVYTSGDQLISGNKTFSGQVVINSTGASSIPFVISGVSGQSAHLFRTINGANGRILTSSRSDGTIASKNFVLFRDSGGNDLDTITLYIYNNYGLMIDCYGGQTFFSNQAGGGVLALGGFIAGTAGYFALGGQNYNSNMNAGQDVYLYRDAAGIFAQRNGVNSQTFRIYNTYTSTGSFERAKIGWNNNSLEIGTEQGTTGGVARDIKFLTSGVERGYLSADGSLLAITGVLQAGSSSNNGAPQIRMWGPSSSQYAGFSRGSGGGTVGDILVWNGNSLGCVLSEKSISLRSDSCLAFVDTTNPYSYTARDVALTRDGAGILGIKTIQGTAVSQIVRIYKTTTGEYGVAGWVGNNFVLGASTQGTGVLWNTIITGANINLIANSGTLNVSGQILTNQRPFVNGTGVLLSGEVAPLPTTIVYTTGNQVISGNKTFSGNFKASSLSTEPGSLTIYDNVFSGPVMSLVEGANFTLNGIGGTQIDLYGQTITGFTIYSNDIYQNGYPVLTANDNLVYLTGTQTITGTKYFDNLYANNLYVNGTETIVNTTSLNIADNFVYLNATGGARDAGIFINFASDSGSGAYIGWDIPSNSWRFGSGVSGLDLSSLDYIASRSWVTGQSYVSSSQTGSFITTGQTGSFLTTSSNVVYATGDQTISGVKTFNDQTNFSTGVSAAGDFEITNSFNGIVLKSPNGSRYRITVDNDGALRTNLITEVVMGVGGDGPILGVGGDAISPVS